MIMPRIRTIDILFLTLIGMGLLELTPAQVTYEEIRGTIQSLIYSYNQLDNKLERHEHRERALGELMKKAMQSLQKGQKSLEPINGIFGRLDERVSQIETMLITQEEKYNAQTEKFGQAMEHMFKWMRENDECFKRPPNAPTAAPAPVANSLPNEFVQQQQQINKELLAEIKSVSGIVAKLLDNSKDMLQQTEVTFKSVPNTAELLNKIEDKLLSYSVVTPAATVAPVDNTEFENKILEKFDALNDGLAELSASAKKPLGLNPADREFIHGLSNETLNALEAFKEHTLTAADRALATNAERVQQTEANLIGNLQQLNVDVKDSSHLLEKFYTEMNTSYGKMNDGLEIFQKFNNIMMTNSEYVLDTQRKVEFGTLQIVQRIAQLLEKQNAELSTFLRARFDNIDESIINTQLESTKNVSGQIDTEIGQVWRRIEIMTGELTDATDLLKLMQSGHEGYVNSTFSTMIGLSSKVEETKTRMLDMDENLNYLLGKLSLMSSEFKNIKTGLAESLEELRNSFQMLQGRMPTGSGHQNIAKNEYLTDVNLLSKRHADESVERA